MKNAHLQWADSILYGKGPGDVHGSLRGLPRREEIECILADWLAVQIQADAGPLGLPPWPESVRALVPEVLLDELGQVLQGSHDLHGDSLAVLLGGRILGRAIACTDPKVECLDKIFQRRSVGHSFYLAFTSSFIGRLTDDAERRAGWASTIAQEIGPLLRPRPFIESLRPREQDPRLIEQLQRIEEAWRACQTPFAIWQSPLFDSRSLLVQAEASYRMMYLGWLLQLDQRAWLRAIDSLRLPQLMWGARHPLEQDGDLIQVLIDQAPLLFNEEGSWTRSVALLFLLDAALLHASLLQDRVAAAVRHVHSLGKAEERAQADAHSEAAQAEVPSWLQRVYHRLLGRRDGRVAGIHLLVLLLRRRRSTDEQALAALCEVMAQAGVTAVEFRSQWETGEGGLPLLLGAADILERRLKEAAQDLNTEAALLWDWLVRLLVKLDPGLPLLASPMSDEARRQWVYNKLAFLLEQTPDPTSAFRLAYRALLPQRRRCCYIQGEQAINASEVLISLAQFSCARQVLGAASEESRIRARAFFLELFTHLHQISLISINPFALRTLSQDVCRQLLAESFAHLPVISGDDLGATLVPMLALVRGDAWVVQAAYDHLLANRADRALLENLFHQADADPLRAAEEAAIWD